MADIEVDIKKVIIAGNDIKVLANKFTETIDSFFKRLENMTTKTQEWNGVSADEFVRRARIDRKQYDKFGEILKKYGDNLLNTANKLEKKVNCYNER